jgi:hypothetical protein
VTWSTDPAVQPPTLDFKKDDLSERGLLGPAATAEFELDEGQVCVFVLRQIGDWGYATKEHERIANPNAERAKTLGVDMEVLVSATTNLRPPENPMLSRVSSIRMGVRGLIVRTCWKG